VIALRSDALDRRKLVLGGQCALAAALLGLSWARSPWAVALGLALAGTASGVTCGAAQASLVASDPGRTERVLARWSLFGAIGDVLTPLLTASALALGRSYRAALGAVALVVAAQCAALACSGRRPATGRGDDAAAEVRATGAQEGAGHEGATHDVRKAPEPPRQALRRAVRLPRLWAWLFAAASCTLLDEIVVALAALRLRGDEGVAEALSSAAGTTFCLGSVAGAACTDVAVRHWGARRVLVASGVACALALTLLCAARGAGWQCAALLAVGLTCAPHHALAMARAYDELPDNPGVVQAITQAFVLIDVAAPPALGWIADRLGLRAAIGALLLQPLVVVACAWRLRPSPRTRG